jgi:hypothetical protein
MFGTLESAQLFYSDVDGKERSYRNYGGDSWFVFKATDQDAGYVQDKSVMEDAPALSLSTAIAGPSGNRRQVSQVRDYQERTGVCEKVERTK